MTMCVFFKYIKQIGHLSSLSKTFVLSVFMTVGSVSAVLGFPWSSNKVTPSISVYSSYLEIGLKGMGGGT